MMELPVGEMDGKKVRDSMLRLILWRETVA